MNGVSRGSDPAEGSPWDPETQAAPYSSLLDFVISCKQTMHPSWTQRRSVLSSQMAAREPFIDGSVSALKSERSFYWSDT